MSDIFAIREAVEDFALRFRGWANVLAMQFGGPVYLVGSYVLTEHAGDIDLRLQLTRDDMDTWFGKSWDHPGLDWPRAKWNREREQLKQSRRLSRAWRGYPVNRFDFQFQCALFSDFTGLPIMQDKPHVRLDVTPLEYFAAGRGDP